MSKPLLATKLKNQLKAIAPDIVTHLKNNRINGNPVGCSGFVHFPDSAKIVYVDTELGLLKKPLYRGARHHEDYTGGRNRFSESLDTLAQDIIDHLNSGYRFFADF